MLNFELDEEEYKRLYRQKKTEKSISRLIQFIVALITIYLLT